MIFILNQLPSGLHRAGRNVRDTAPLQNWEAYFDCLETNFSISVAFVKLMTFFVRQTVFGDPLSFSSQKHMFLGGQLCDIKYCALCFIEKVRETTADPLVPKKFLARVRRCP